MPMNISFTGPNSNFVTAAFFGTNGIDLNVISATATQIVVQQLETGAITTLTGTGFALDATDSPTAGTINGVNFALGGSTSATISGISWGLVAFDDALAAIDLSDNFGPMAALFSAQPILVDASSATVGYYMTELATIASLITSTITVLGSDFDDVLIGGAGNDTITPGHNEGYDYLIGSAGNDVYDFTGATIADFYEMSYGLVTGPVVVTLNAQTNTGSVVNTGWTDTLLGVQDAAHGDGISISGTAGNDTFNLIGGNAASWVAAGGAAGNDTFNLTLNGGMRLYYNWSGEGMTAPTQGLVMDLVTGVVSNDGFGDTDLINVLGGTGRLEIRGTDHADSILGSARTESFILEQGNDTLDGGGGDDLLRYDRNGVAFLVVNLVTGIATGTWDGHNFTHSITNIQSVRGTDGGSDLIIGGAASEYLDGRTGGDTLSGGAGDDTLFGSGGYDVLYGGDGNDELDGGNGNDELWGGAGADLFYAGDGEDQLGGGAGDDTLDGGAGNDVLYGGADNDELSGGAGNDELWADIGNDELYGGDGADQLGAGAGDDILFGDDGADTLYGGAGNDTLDGGAGNDEIWADIGNDVLLGGDGEDQLGGGAGDDTLWSGTGNDTLYGGQGDDVLDGDEGNDELWGMDGNDLIDGSFGQNTLGGGLGNDTLRGGTDADLIYGGLGLDWIVGGAGNDTVWAGDGSDFLAGEEGNDELWAGAGNDRLYGGAGDDMLSGGDGADIFVFEVGGGADRVVDFDASEGDMLQLDHNLWALSGTLTAAQVVTQFGALNAGHVVLTFDGGESVVLTGFTDLAGLGDHIII